jgi:uncharacterized protein (TIGR03437 family)
LQGVVSAASFDAVVSPNSWITIRGTDLAPAARVWSAADIADGKLPVVLDGVTVSVNGKPAYVQYISPAQINALSPEDNSTGPIEVKVSVNGQSSDAAIVRMQNVAPALFTFNGTAVAAAHADGTLVGKPGLLDNAATSPAMPGEIIVLFGSGLGATTPVIPAGQLTDRVAALADPLKITIGGVPAEAVFAGLVPPFAGLYQINVRIPDAATEGDQPVIVETGGAASASTARLAIGARI